MIDSRAARIFNAAIRQASSPEGAVHLAGSGERNPNARGRVETLLTARVDVRNALKTPGGLCLDETAGIGDRADVSTPNNSPEPPGRASESPSRRRGGIAAVVRSSAVDAMLGTTPSRIVGVQLELPF
jgi:hypothetical protein